MIERNAADALQATEPAASASVHASAGTGKTWMLTTRIIRLLLAGARPDGILAVTFTRKAAAEMQQRVTGRLRDLMAAPEEQLDQLLGQCGVEPSGELRDRARRLYEQLLYHPYPLRSTTFHAFCQELLSRFPLEAGVTPGFVIGESTGLLEQAAHDALVAESAQDPDGAVARALDELVERCGGLASAVAALKSFLAQRSDWWAFTQGQDDAAGYAGERLTELLGGDAAGDPLGGFPDAGLRNQLSEFADLLARHATKTNTRQAGAVTDALRPGVAPQVCLDAVAPVFFKTDGAPRARRPSAAQARSLGAAGEERLLELDRTITRTLLGVRERQARHNTLRTGLAWYTAGVRLLQHYQRIKQEQRLLDFADLEWRACELLNRSEHASWVQYKLDTRIDHLLVDEFQDTNPTQWRLLLPLLQELAAGVDDRNRSVFLVGDIKQSIYGFRRAKPALMQEASRWLRERLDARGYPLDASRRSAQAIMACVNGVFTLPALQGLLSEFNVHETHLADLQGRVELLPLAMAEPVDPVAPGESALRNPLLTPRSVSENQGHYREGCLIAERIGALVDNRTPVSRDGRSRPVDYGDIMILLRQRTHAPAYERALRDAGIPYLGAGNSLLLDTLEVRDLEALLNLLISPYDNLALAQVLRSPLFSLDSEQLLPLAGLQAGTWYERLAGLAARGKAPWRTVYEMLEAWRSLAGQVPVHDLLDRIYHQGDVMQRYLAASPETLQPRVRASLTRFIELALEVDNGRYPSLPRFLDQLTRLRQSDGDQPEEGTADEAGSRRVRLMTIHGAKGLEAPVVFLADATTTPRDRNAWSALVDWPPTADRPAHFLLAGSAAVRDAQTARLLGAQSLEAQREAANLLYVAMTRARQYLFVSGTRPARGSELGWYGLVREAAADWATGADGNPVLESGRAAEPDPVPDMVPAPIEPDPRLSRPVAVPTVCRQIAPSHHAQAGAWEDGDADGRERGQAIHLMLERLSRDPGADRDAMIRDIAVCLQRKPGEPDLQDWWQEALRVYRGDAFAELFDPDRYERAFSEVPVQYLDGDRLVYGIIDRLVVQPACVLVVDYKTHRGANAQTIPELVESYRNQLRLYAEAAGRLWPEREIRPSLLFTACGELATVG